MMLSNIKYPIFALRITLSLLATGMSLSYAGTAFAEAQSIPVKLDPNRITSVELSAPATGIAMNLPTKGEVEIRVLEGAVWSPWMELHRDNDAYPWERNSDLITTADALKVDIRSTESANATLYAIAVDSAPASWEEAAARKLVAPVIVPRWQWGADESLRVSKRNAADVKRIFEANDPFLADLVRNCDRRAYLYPEEFQEVNRKFTDDEGNTLIWPVGYSREVHMIVIHHTAESSPAALQRSDIERMRTVYAYHTVTRKWGDIGYNFVIGPEGTIFEGRAGGDYVTGAHAYCNNIGTMGIALMGNFQQDRPTEEQLIALRWLLVDLTQKYKIDPISRTIHHGKSMPTILGHRDVGQTACPGNYSHELLPQIRFAAKERELDTPLFSSVAAQSTQDEAALIESIQPLDVGMGESKELLVRYMNVGMDTWDQTTWLLGEADPGLYFIHYRPYSFVAGRLREKQVKPGEVGTFVVELQGGLSEKIGTVKFTPVINNQRRMLKNAATVAFHTKQGSPRYTVVTSSFPPLHKTGEDLTGTVKILNSGSVPWELNTITELGFDLDGGSGEVSILNHPGSIAPGEQGLFRVRLHNVEEEGPYKRMLVGKFEEDSKLVGMPILVASRAEPIPDLSLNPSSQYFASTSGLPTSGFAPDDSTILEALAGTDLTLSPKQQANISIRIRAGKQPISRLQPIATIVRSTPTLVIAGENNIRMRQAFRSPASLQPYQTIDTELTLIAPSQEGTYTFSIGNLPYQLTVSSTARSMIRKSVPRKIVERALSRERVQSIQLDRRDRHALLVPKPIHRSDGTTIRIRLSYDKNDAILATTGEMHIESEGSIINASGPIHLSKERNFCKVTTGNGHALGPVVKFASGNPRGTTTILTLSKSTNEFRGVIECRIIDGQMVLINDLPLEDYLAGLAEEPDSEPYEKQRAFAIAARSYAAFYVLSDQKKFKGMPYDGSDSPKEFQAYGGVFFEQKNPKWVDAVKSTEGQILTWQRRIVKAPYFSTDDGRTKAAIDVWGWQNSPYLDAKDDPWCIGMQNWGHGVGMSGCGAKGQANEGKSAEHILQYYYPGTLILPIEKAQEWEKRLGG